MWTRREQLTAYQFLQRRLVNALVVANPNHVERPNRRLVIGVIVGAALSLIALGVTAIVGFISPGNSSSWRDGGSIIIERETGARYVLDENGVLRPALNYASALLFLGREADATVVSRASLSGTPRGLPIGIPGAPDSLADADSLMDGPWTACSQVPLDVAGEVRPVVAAQLGLVPQGAALAGDAGLLVSGPTGGQRHLVVDGRRHAITSDTVAAALGYAGARAVPVGGAWLNVVPAGPDLEMLSVPEAGAPGPEVEGSPSRVGQVFELADLSGRTEFAVMAQDGLREVTAVAATLLLASPDNAGRNDGGVPTPLSRAGAAAAPRSAQPGPGVGTPDELPAPVEVTGDEVAACGTLRGAGTESRMDVRLLPRMPGLPGIQTLAGTEPSPSPDAADLVMVTPGEGALVRPETQGSDTLAPPSLVTDQGIRYPLAEEAVGVLGYGSAAVAEAPAEFLALLPTGPALDTAVVVDEVGGGSLRASADGHFSRDIR